MSNVVTAPDSIQPASIDFSALMAKAMDHPSGNDIAAPLLADPVINAPAPTATPEPQVAATPAPVVEAPAVVTPADQKILDLPEDGLYRVKIDGKEELVSAKDYRDGIQREAVFTKRMQGLAEQRREAEAALAAQYAQVQSQAQAVEAAQRELWNRLQTPQAVVAQTPQNAPDPGDLATMGDVQSQLNAALAQIQSQYAAREQQLVGAIGAASQQVQEKVALERDAAAYNAGLQSILSKPEFQMLKQALPYAEESIRYQVAAMDPQSIQEAIQYTDVVAKEWTGKMRATFADTQQRQEVARAHAKLEPTTHSSPPAPATPYKPGSAFGKDGKFDWNALSARAAAMMP